MRMSEQIKGLSTEDVRRSKELHGDNSLKKEKTKGFFRCFIENLCDPIIKILLIVMAVEVILTLGRCNWFEIGGILLAVLIAATVSTVSEFGSARAFESMQAEAGEGFVRVYRDGALQSLPIASLVVGDVIELSAGERVPADGVVYEGAVSVDQSALNGESRDVEKRVGRPLATWDLSDGTRLFRGSLITTGQCIMTVLRVGASTYYGTVAKDVQSETRESPLKLRLAKLASQISKIGYVMAACVALTYLFQTFVVDRGFVLSRIVDAVRDLPFLFSSLLHAITLMITVIVVAVPEGLPMMITVVLCANMKRMLRDGVLVKKPVGIETAGSMNILFTDKTGTLTTGKLSCEQIMTPIGVFRSASALKKTGQIYQHLLLCAKYNTECRVSGKDVLGGNSTDRAIATFFLAEPSPSALVKHKVPFTSEQKFASVTLRTARDVTLIKGAPERILSTSAGVLLPDGHIRDGGIHEFTQAYRAAAAAGERVIALAAELDGKRVLIALFFLKDRLRRGVREALASLSEAGIQTVMMTGDGLLTATAIAAECGLYKARAGHVALECTELSRMSDEEIKELLPRLRVLARALPSDKRRLVRLSQELGLVVGMTGDGINDAPSLKLADVGFAMGAGADIAKDSSDVVLLDNSLTSIVHTTLYGRTIFSSIRKFITFQLMMNLAACGVSLFGQCIGIDSPITIIQMLWVNIIMDTLGGLAFAGEAPLASYMKEKPKRRDEPLLTRGMLGRIALTGGFTLLLCLAFLKLPLFESMFRVTEDRGYFLTGFYVLFIFAGLFNCFNARSERLRMFSGIEKNKPFLIIMLLIACIQVFIVYFGGSLFRAYPLTASEFLRVILLSLLVIPFDFLRRVFAKLSSTKGKS